MTTVRWKVFCKPEKRVLLSVGVCYNTGRREICFITLKSFTTGRDFIAAWVT